MVIVDTSVWVDYLRAVSTPQTDWLHREMEKQRLGVVDLILCEVLQGVLEDGCNQRCESTLKMQTAKASKTSKKLPQILCGL